MIQVQGLSYNSTIPNMGYALNAPANEKLSLPVAPSSLIYSHLKHVYGVPSPDGHGVAISKLNILDVLIEQMKQFRKIPDFSAAGVREDMIDAMIDSYKSQIFMAKEAGSSMPYVSAPLAETGLLFSFTA